MSTYRTYSHTEPLPSCVGPSTRLSEDSKSRRKEKILHLSRSKIIRERSKSLSMIRSTIKSVVAHLKTSNNSNNTEYLHIVIILGASTCIAQMKLYPALWNLFKNGLLPPNIRFYGFARLSTTVDELREKCRKFMHVQHEEEHKYEAFWNLSNYFIRSYILKIDYEALNKDLSNFGTINNYSNRLFYIALSNNALEHVTRYLKIITPAHKNCTTFTGSKGWTRVMVEKPFGRDTASCLKFSKQLLSIFREDQIYRIGHYLGTEVVQNVITIRFANFLLSSTWNRNFIQSVLITLKDPHGVRFNKRYFDSYGIIRDVMQNHLLQILSLIAMERPISIRAKDIQDEKVKLLRCIPVVNIEDVVLGQYCCNPIVFEGERKVGYRQEPDIPKDSLTPTFCTAVLNVKNERWDGVPFILKCGKALNVKERSTQIRIQYKETPGKICEGKRNELVIQVEPNEGVYIKAMTKSPSVSLNVEEKDLLLGQCYKKTHKVFERLMMDVFSGSHVHFISSDEVLQASRIFTPLLNQIDNDKIRPKLYINGSEGPREADELIRKNKFIVYE